MVGLEVGVLWRGMKVIWVGEWWIDAGSSVGGTWSIEAEISGKLSMGWWSR